MRRGREKTSRDPAAAAEAKTIRARAARVLAAGTNRFNLAVCFLLSLCGTGFFYAALSTLAWFLLPDDAAYGEAFGAAVLALAIVLSAPLRAGYFAVVSKVAAGKSGFSDYLKPFSSFSAFFRALFLENVRIFSIITPFFLAVAAGEFAADAVWQFSETGADIIFFIAPFFGAALCLPFSVLTRRARVFAMLGLANPDAGLSDIKADIYSLDPLKRAALFKNDFLHVLSIYASVLTVLVLSAVHTAHLFALSGCLAFESDDGCSEEQSSITEGDHNE